MSKSPSRKVIFNKGQFYNRKVEHESLAVVIPKLNTFFWHIAYVLAHILVWFPYLFLASFVGKEALERWCPKRGNRLTGAAARPQNYDYAGRDAARQHHGVYTEFDEHRHHRYTPGNNPNGEDLTLMVRQGLFGI